MPKAAKKTSSGFNLIRKEVAFERKLKSETSWYSSFNFVVILTITAIAGLAFAFTLFNNNALTNKKVEVTNYANNNVLVNDKAEIESKISVLNDKFTLYQEVKGESIDVGTFYNDMNNLYPGLKFNRFNFKPGQAVEAEVTLPNNGYTELPKFLQALYAKFDNVSVKQISFQNATSTQVSSVITLIFEREEPTNAE
jgi:hypothetical protein